MSGPLLAQSVRALPSRAVIWVFHLAIPVVALAVLLAFPTLDVRWEDHVAHLWIVAAAAGVSVVLAATVGRAARDHGDARLALIAFAFGAAAIFFAVHALVTPAVLHEGANAAFLLSTPFGLVLAGAFILVAYLELSPESAAFVARWQVPVAVALVVLAVIWIAFAFRPGSPLAEPLDPASATLLLRLAGLAGLALFVPAIALQFRAYRRAPSVVLLSMLTASVLLAETLVVIAESRSWHLSWWLWHVLLVLAFGYVAYSAHVAYRRERGATALFTALSLEETLERVREEYGSALEALVAAIDTGGSDVGASVHRVASRFDLTDGQAAVLERAALAVVSDRDLIRRLDALVRVGHEGRVGLGERELVRRAGEHLAGAFRADRVRVALTGEDGAYWVGTEEREGEAVTDARIALAMEHRELIEEDGPPARIVVPLIGREGPLGAVEAVRLAGEFEERDRALLESLGAELAILIENTRLYRRVDRLFRQFVPPEVAEQLLADPRRADLGGAVGEVTILFGDLRGYTSYAEARGPGEVVRLLNAYFGTAAPIILKEGGTVVQFVGDAIMAIWNAPVAQPDHALRACRAALRIQEAIEPLAAARPGAPRFRIGINTGMALVGTIGSEAQRDFSAVGDAVNLAARLQVAADVGTVVIGPRTRTELGPLAKVRPLGRLELKGRAEHVEAFVLEGLRSEKDEAPTWW